MFACSRVILELTWVKSLTSLPSSGEMFLTPYLTIFLLLKWSIAIKHKSFYNQFQEIMERHESTGLKLKQEVGQIIKEVKASDFCSCFKPNPSNCSTCFRRQVVAMLCHKGFNTKLRISKWGTTKKFPGGSHEYIEVIASTVSRKKQITFLVELEFRDQFKIAKAGKAYQKLVSCLPELYVGKQECLTAIVRVMCEAAKKSLKEKKMHIGPWRKSGFMQMKWSGFNQTWTLENSMGNIPANESHLRISGAPSVVVT
ncbi:hypothetical protein PIB30_001866 [Stylosanthes scabra]|uniref:Uncharacterized protein n=1 Tax=Stylosanthes scabra TaxID=79078 RepID=A0ABU6W372_9FABA|nr:hypothetical protein [Stylosanthes scabra]